jgi:hypothetical protein
MPVAAAWALARPMVLAFFVRYSPPYGDRRGPVELRAEPHKMLLRDAAQKVRERKIKRQAACNDTNQATG